MTEPLSIGRAIERSVLRFRGTEVTDPQLEARMLVEHVLGQPRAWVLAHPEALVDSSADEHLQRLVARRAGGEPIAYIVRKREFFGLDLYVDSRVLIPRPETEVLIDETLQLVRDSRPSAHILDVGTGSGAIALALATNLPSARITAVDCSREALEVASINVERFGLADRIELIQGDIVSWLGSPVDIIVANLPYIPSESIRLLVPEVRDFEPRLALDGGTGGVILNLRLIEELPRLLVPDGHVFLECEPHQIEALRMAASRSVPDVEIDFLLDGNHHARFLHLIRPHD
jgi:release factor glutamine methyltransferase